MNDLAHHRMVQEAVKKKFRGHKVLICKHTPTHPEQAERVYQRMVGRYMRLLNSLLKENLPEIRDAAAREKERMRHDDTSDLLSLVANRWFSRHAD